MQRLIQFVKNKFDSRIAIAMMGSKVAKDLSITAEASSKNEQLIDRFRAFLTKVDSKLDQLDLASDFPKRHEWLNTKGDMDLSLKKELKNKLVVVDFWSSCCINCIHVLAEMEHLEKVFKDRKEVAFVGCHSAKFDNEKDLFMLKQAVIRYDI